MNLKYSKKVLECLEWDQYGIENYDVHMIYSIKNYFPRLHVPTPPGIPGCTHSRFPQHLPWSIGGNVACTPHFSSSILQTDSREINVKQYFSSYLKLI